MVQSYKIDVSATIPSKEDFFSKKQYKIFNNVMKDQTGINLFDAIMTPESFLRCKIVTEFDLPAVAAVAEKCKEIVENLKEELQLKQFIGAVVCCLMEANGYEKTNKKKAIPHDAFSKGEFYKLV